VSGRRIAAGLAVLAALLMFYQGAFYLWLAAHPHYVHQIDEIRRALVMRLVGFVLAVGVLAWLWITPRTAGN
jgi:hypothetical protein